MRSASTIERVGAPERQSNDPTDHAAPPTRNGRGITLWSARTKTRCGRLFPDPREVLDRPPSALRRFVEAKRSRGHERPRFPDQSQGRTCPATTTGARSFSIAATLSARRGTCCSRSTTTATCAHRRAAPGPRRTGVFQERDLRDRTPARRCSAFSALPDDAPLHERIGAVHEWRMPSALRRASSADDGLGRCRSRRDDDARGGYPTELAQREDARRQQDREPPAGEHADAAVARRARRRTRRRRRPRGRASNGAKYRYWYGSVRRPSVTAADRQPASISTPTQRAGRRTSTQIPLATQAVTQRRSPATFVSGPIGGM